MNGQIIPEETEKSIEVKQENATFLVIGDKAYTSEIIEEYNRNAEAKTEDFNENAESKIASYNSNAADRTAAFNNNYDDKLASFNSNANTQTEEFDSHVLMQTNTFNNNATSTITNYNTNAEQKTYEFNQNALSYKEGIEDNTNRIKRLETDIFDSGNASGTSINLQDSTLAEFKEINIDGNLHQETTTGKNLFKTIPTQTKAGITLTNNNDGSYTLNGTATNNTSFYVTGLNYEAGTYTISSNNEVSNSNDGFYLQAESSGGDIKEVLTIVNSKKTATTTAPITAISIVIPNGLELNNFKIKPQLEIGGNATEFEPYTGGIASPSPDYPQEIEVIEDSFDLISCGKNLFNKDLFEDFTVNLKYVNLILKPNKQYTVSSNLPKSSVVNAANLFAYNSSDLGASTGRNDIGVSTTSRTVTTNSDGIITIAYRDNNDEYSDEKSSYFYQIEEGTQATDYEPYQSTTTTITLPENEFVGKISDTVKDKFSIRYNDSDARYHLYLEKNILKNVFDGSETGWVTRTGSTLYSYQLNNVFDGNNCSGICSHWRFIKGGATASQSNECITSAYTNNSVDIFTNNNSLSTLDNFKSWLSTNNVEVYYQLAEPYTLDLGVVDMPLSYYPVTNVYTTCDLQPTIEVLYYRDFKGTINTMQDDLTSASSKIGTLESDVNTLKEQVAQLMTSATLEESEGIE